MFFFKFPTKKNFIIPTKKTIMIPKKTTIYNPNISTNNLSCNIYLSAKIIIE